WCSTKYLMENLLNTLQNNLDKTIKDIKQYAKIISDKEYEGRKQDISKAREKLSRGEKTLKKIETITREMPEDIREKYKTKLDDQQRSLKILKNFLTEADQTKKKEVKVIQPQIVSSDEETTEEES